MKFRFVLLNPDDEPEQRLAVQPDVSVVSPGPSSAAAYAIRAGEMVRRVKSPDGRWRHIAVANFAARIVTDIIRDDGIEQSRDFGLEVTIGGQTKIFAVPATVFGRMGWVLPKLGPQAIIYPSQQQHARAAIQSLSAATKQERILTHLGWRRHEADWLYLHGGGAVGASRDSVNSTTGLAWTGADYRRISQLRRMPWKAWRLPPRIRSWWRMILRQLEDNRMLGCRR